MIVMILVIKKVLFILQHYIFKNTDHSKITLTKPHKKRLPQKNLSQKPHKITEKTATTTTSPLKFFP